MEYVHIDQVKALAHSAHNDIAMREHLFADALGGERSDAYIALWALTHLPQADTPYIAMHRDELTALALTTGDSSLRRLSMVLLERLEWTVDDVRTDLLDFCLEHMMMTDEPYGVRSLCIKLAYRQCHHYTELKNELRQALMLMEPSELGSGVRHTRNKILKLL